MIYKRLILDEYVGIPSPKFKNITGQTFGDWKVICRAPNSNKCSMFWCECSCGKIKKVYSKHLTRGLTRQCLKCSTQKLSTGKVKMIGDIPESFWKEFISRACGEKSRESRRKLKFNITLEDAWNIYLNQDRKCALTGIQIGFCVNYSLDKKGYKKHWKHTASLDRINSTKDYVIDNVQWVHKDINIMKNVFDQEYFINICKLIAEKHK